MTDNPIEAQPQYVWFVCPRAIDSFPPRIERYEWTRRTRATFTVLRGGYSEVVEDVIRVTPNRRAFLTEAEAIACYYELCGQQVDRLQQRMRELKENIAKLEKARNFAAEIEDCSKPWPKMDLTLD